MRKANLSIALICSLAFVHIGWNCGAASGSDDSTDLTVMGALFASAGARNLASVDFNDPAQVQAYLQSLETPAERRMYDQYLAQEVVEADLSHESTPDATDSVSAAPAVAPANTIEDARALSATVAAASAPAALPALAGVTRDYSTQPFKPGPRYNGSSGAYHIILERVTYCAETNFLGICKTWATQGEYRHWLNAGVSRGKRKDTYIARYSNPPKADTEFIMFGAAGQQPTIPFHHERFGVDNAVTGQYYKFKEPFEKTTPALWVPMDNNSMMRRAESLTDASGNAFFPGSKTFKAVAYDTKLNYTVGKAEKGKMERAYFNWLKTKGDPAKLKLIYLAGSSRGGCLVLRLAKLLRQDPVWRDVPIILHSFDSVCAPAGTPVDDYLNITTTPLWSTPIPPWALEVPFEPRLAFHMNPDTTYPHNNRLRIRTVVSGDYVVIPLVRPWARRGSNGNWGWYRQKWLQLKHLTLGRKYEASHLTIEPMLEHLKLYFPILTAPPAGPIEEAEGVDGPDVIAPGGGGGTGGGVGVGVAGPAVVAPAGGGAGTGGGLAGAAEGLAGTE